MSAGLEYAPDGLIGVLTPQANTTVEPELAILAPVGVGILTARLTSSAPEMQDRLIAYGTGIDGCLDQFANAPITVAAFACTGASYLVDGDEENARLSDILRQRGTSIVTAAQAVLDALSLIGVSRVGLISPYSGSLHESALRFWRGRGFEIAEVIALDNDETAFHPIYALDGAAAHTALTQMALDPPDAVVILGTGLPSLGTILTNQTDVPVLSPNLCLMWRCLTALSGEAPSMDNLTPWLNGDAWGYRFRARCRT